MTLDTAPMHDSTRLSERTVLHQRKFFQFYFRTGYAHILYSMKMKLYLFSLPKTILCQHEMILVHTCNYAIGLQSRVCDISARHVHRS